MFQVPNFSTSLPIIQALDIVCTMSGHLNSCFVCDRIPQPLAPPPLLYTKIVGKIVQSQILRED